MRQPLWRIMLFLLVASMAFAPARAPAQTGAPSAECGVVQVMDLILRSGPGLDRRPLKTIEKGAVVFILEKGDGWLKISHEGQTGYVLNRPQYIATAAAALPDDDPASGESQADALPYGGKEGPAEPRDGSGALLESLAQGEAAVIDELHTCELALDGARQQVAAMEKELAQLTAHIAEKQRALEELQQQVSITGHQACQRAVALYKLCWLGYLPVLASSESGMDFSRRKSALERILAHDQRLLSDLAAEKEALARLLGEMNADLAARQTAEATLRDRLAQMTREAEKKSRLLADIRNQKALHTAALKSIERSAKALDQTLLSLSSPEPAADSPTPSAGRPFSSLKGLLNLPVRGKIVSFFGSSPSSERQAANFHSGIGIQAERGDPIRSVGPGTTLFADWFKGFGNLIIIDHGDHYYTVYAHLEEVFKSKGSRVESEEVIATVGDSGSMSGPALHFEIRHHGKALDPMEWLDNVKRSHLHD